uniref:Protein kinase domain-containing protein n=1 Tax=Cannabis sativa TaxID=3483 RepID=A0A803PIC6_CANSA
MAPIPIPIPLFVFFIIITTHSLLSISAHDKCPPFFCGKLGSISFPYNNKTNPECGVFTVDCSEENKPKIQLKEEGHWYAIKNISQANSILIEDTTSLPSSNFANDCETINSFALPRRNSSLFSYNLTAENSLTFYNCSHSVGLEDFGQIKCRGRDRDYDLFLYKNISSPMKQQCPMIELPLPTSRHHEHDPFSILFTFQAQISFDCASCHFLKGGKCYNNEQNQLVCLTDEGDEKKKPKLALRLGLGLGLGCGIVLTIIGLGIIMWRRKQKHVVTKTMADDPHMNIEDVQGRTSGYLGGVLVFSYKDLTQATNNFHSKRELGHGGFGTVYYGKLKDRREVAVKRFYEHNYKRVEQFMNEIKILTLLRHKNLVSLYGCTSRRSRELLLVYEYIPNGTVADHLHGHHAKTSPLTWPIRLSIAIETATALAYLHASDIVHRDVKTNNILLDNNFSVKVADFGLSRLFPNDVTHVSTAPQGTPGYVDPEYHQCYQLTSKSDVYSFGVVLVELLSSMPAVDITRHRDEINLSNLAICKIQKRAYNELIDEQLGFGSNIEVRNMTIGVAELAFECLQQDKEMRPTMDEVLERLKRIEIENYEVVGGNSSSELINMSNVGLSKNIKHEPLPSPNAVIENWPSTSTPTTPNFSA